MSHDSYLNKLEEKFNTFPWGDKTAYCNWLAQTYFYVCKSTRLLALASANCRDDQQSLHYRYIKHAAEESGHEKLLERDLKELGTHINNYQPHPTTSGFVQCQYYWIQNVGPESFMGFIYALEGLAVKSGETAYKKIKEAHGDKCSNFVRVHSEEDIDHLQKAEKQIKSMSEQEYSKFLENLKVSSGLYISMLDACQKSSTLTLTQAA